MLKKALVSTKTASELYGYHPDYLSRLCREGKLQASQIGGAWFIEPRSIEAFVKHQQDVVKEQQLIFRKGMALEAVPYQTSSLAPMVVAVALFIAISGLVLVAGDLKGVAKTESLKGNLVAAAVMPVFSPISAAQTSALFVYETIRSLFETTYGIIVAILVGGGEEPIPVEVVREQPVVPVFPQPKPPAPTIQIGPATTTPRVVAETVVDRRPINQYVTNAITVTGVTKEYVDDRIAYLLGRQKDVDANVDSGGSSGTVTSVDVSAGTTGFSFAGGPVTSSGTFTLSGTLDVDNGGTGLASTPSYGQLMIGDGAGGYTLVATSTLNIIGAASTPGGADTQVQFNDAGSFAGDSGFTYNATADRVTFTNASTTAFSSAYASSSNAFFGSLFSNYATTTSFGLNSETITDLTGTGLQITGNALTINATGDWTGTLDGQEGSFYLSRANHTGSQTASTISDFDTAVNSYIHSSTTIPKTYSANTFTAAQVFSGGLTLGTLNGPLQANNGLISATTSIGVLYGGTGLTSAPSYGQLLMGNGSGGYALTATTSLGLQSVLSGTQGQLTYFSGTDTAVGTSSIFIATSGNVGVGTTSPQAARFSVASLTAPQISLSDGSNSSAPWNLRSINGNFYFATSSPSTFATSSPALTITTSGNFGIGTTSPYAKFAVRGGGTSSGVNFQTTNSSDAALFTILDSGNVGLGTTSPYGKLTVMGSNDQTLGLLIGNAGQGGNPWYLGRDGAVSGRLAIGNGTTEAISVLTTGNVGVGTTTPYRKFSVTDAVSTAQVAVSYDTDRYTTFLTDSVGDLTIDAQGADIRANDENLWICAAGACPSGTPAGTGNLIVETALGVGTSTPSQQLAVAANLFVGNSGATGLGQATSTFQGDIRILGKLDVSTIDPVYQIAGVKYATYGHSTVGVKEETVMKIPGHDFVYNAEHNRYEYEIKFSSLKEGSDLWLFYQISDFGSNWENLVVSLTPGFDGEAYYEEHSEEGRLVIVSTQAGPVSTRLIAPRHDSDKWPNLRPDQDDDFFHFFLPGK